MRLGGGGVEGEGAKQENEGPRGFDMMMVVRVVVDDDDSYCETLPPRRAFFDLAVTKCIVLSLRIICMQLSALREEMLEASHLLPPRY